MFGCNNDRLELRNIHGSFLFARKERVNVERVPTGHSIILLTSNKFNVTAVSEKRSITLLLYPMPLYRSISNSSCSVTPYSQIIISEDT